MRKEIKYTELSVAEMFAMYNDRAEVLGKPPMRKKPDRCAMVKELALLMTLRDPVPVGRVRDVVIEELCKIAFYKNEVDGERVEVTDHRNIHRRGLLSVGFPYSVVLDRIKSRVPNSRISMAALLVHATNIRKKKKGYRHATMPPKRQRATKESAND